MTYGLTNDPEGDTSGNFAEAAPDFDQSGGKDAKQTSKFRLWSI